MPRILLFHAVDKMLEVIAVPFPAETLHDLDPVPGVLFPVLWELVDTSFPLAEIMGTDIVQLIVINVDLPTDNFEPYRFESIIPWNRIPASFIQDVRQCRDLIGAECIRRCFIHGWKKRTQGCLFNAVADCFWDP